MSLIECYQQVIDDVRAQIAYLNPDKLPDDQLSEHVRQQLAGLFDMLSFLQMRQSVLRPDSKPGQPQE